MFDYFDCDVKCPVCSNSVSDFQTKDFDRCFDHYQPGDLVDRRSLKSIRVYTTCPHLRVFEKFENDIMYIKTQSLWIEYIIPIIRGHIVRDQNLWRRSTHELNVSGIRFHKRDTFTEQDARKEVEVWNKKITDDIRITEFERKLHEEIYTTKS